MSYVWINGQLVDKSEAKISVFDHGFLYGDGVWEHFRAFGGKLFRPNDGVSWLFAWLHSLAINITPSKVDVLRAIEDTLRANNRTDGYIRVIVSRGAGTLGPDLRKLDPQIIVIAEEYHPFPVDLYEHGLHVVISEPAVWSDTHPPSFRTLSQLHIIKAKSDALAQGCLEAVILDECGRFLGCTEGHLFRFVEGQLRATSFWPFDVVQDEVKSLAQVEGVPFATRIEKDDVNLHTDDLLYADEVFLAGTSCGVIAIVRVNGQPIGNGKEGPVTKRIREAYRKLTTGERGA